MKFSRLLWLLLVLLIVIAVLYYITSDLDIPEGRGNHNGYPF
jgi:hypothetical protein